MRRCPRCTSLVDGDGACPACGHWPNRPAAATAPPARGLLDRPVKAEDVAGPVAVAAARRRRQEAPRPPGVSALGWIGIVLGCWTMLRAVVGVFEVLRLSEQFARLGPRVAEFRGFAIFLLLLVLFVGAAIVLVSLAFLRGSAWAWWVTLVYDLLAAADLLLLSMAFPWSLLPPELGAVRWLAWALLLADALLIAYLFAPAVRRYFFPPGTFLAPEPIEASG